MHKNIFDMDKGESGRSAQLSLPDYPILKRDLSLSRKGGEKQYLVCFDVMSMHRLNSVYGRGAGDELLSEVISWLEHEKKPESQIYRVEGDSFCIRLQNVNGMEAKRRCMKLYDRFSDSWTLHVGGKVLDYNCGVTVCLLWIDSVTVMEDLKSLIERTLDIARHNKNFYIYDEQTDRALKDRMRLSIHLQNSVSQGMLGFEVHYQPIVEPFTGQWKALEALCRWTCPGLGLVSPLVFIHEAERSGLISEIGDWVLETAVRQCKEIGLDKRDGFFLSVNLSPVQLESNRFVPFVENILSKYLYPGKKLNLELTETIELTIDQSAVTAFERLRGSGVTITLDDFGSGYSSFQNFKNIPVDYVKTERALLQGIEHSKTTQSFYRTMSLLSHTNDIKLIAEGVETLEQLELAQKNGADYIQGFFFSKALPVKELAY